MEEPGESGFQASAGLSPSLFRGPGGAAEGGESAQRKPRFGSKSRRSEKG